MWTKLNLILATVIHLKWIQVFYQVYYKIRNRVFDPIFFGTLKGYVSNNEVLNLTDFSFVPPATAIEWQSIDRVNFTFLNLSQSFGKRIDWNYSDNGKLWTYNLNYFDFLFQSSVSKEQGRGLIEDYCSNYMRLKDGLEPYPISLRGINWVKFLSKNNVQDDTIDRCLYKQFKVLESNLEYHILANHLLENAFALFFGAYYFKNENFYRKSIKLLKVQLKEQILSDGAHYERSPMYHQILLFRLLDTINLVQNNSWKSREFLGELIGFAQSMLSWLSSISFHNGEVPYLKDSTKGIAPNKNELIDYAKLLELSLTKTKPLSDSGYRKFSNQTMELIVDIGEVAPSYQPGHAHADELNFVLNINDRPIIVDVGISTYEKNQRRQLERSTESHNCIMLNSQSSSEVWGGFRVAKRAKTRLINESVYGVEAEHTGFKSQGLMIKRKVGHDESIIWIEDYLTGKGTMINSTLSFLHFHPDVNVRISGNDIFADNVEIKLKGFHSFKIENYEYASGFNYLLKAKKLVLKPSEFNRIEIYYAD